MLSIAGIVSSDVGTINLWDGEEVIPHELHRPSIIGGSFFYFREGPQLAVSCYIPVQNPMFRFAT